MAKEISGTEIREVWDWRLSNGNPIIYNTGDTWVVKVWANKSPDGKGTLLAEWDSGVPTKDENGRKNHHDAKAVAVCHKWLYENRDKFSRDNIELRKPVVKLINDSNKELGKVLAEALQATDKDQKDMLMGRYKRMLDEANEKIKAASKKMRQDIEGMPAGGGN